MTGDWAANSALPNLPLIFSVPVLQQKSISIFHHHYPAFAFRQMGQLPLAVAVQQVVENDVEVVAFFRVEADADVGHKHFIQAVVLQIGAGGKFGIQQILQFDTDQVAIKRCLTCRKFAFVKSVKTFEVDVRRYFVAGHPKYFGKWLGK